MHRMERGWEKPSEVFDIRKNYLQVDLLLARLSITSPMMEVCPWVFADGACRVKSARAGVQLKCPQGRSNQKDWG